MPIVHDYRTVDDDQLIALHRLALYLVEKGKPLVMRRRTATPASRASLCRHATGSTA